MDEATSKVFILPFHMKQQYIKENEKNIFEDPEVSYLKNLDEELKRILFEPGLQPDVKYKKYMDLFTKYNAVKQNVTQPFEIEIKTKMPDSVMQQQEGTDSLTQKPENSRQNQESLNKDKEVEKTKPSVKRPISGQLKQTLENLRGLEHNKAMEIVKHLKMTLESNGMTKVKSISKINSSKVRTSAKQSMI
jgi:hypothetical protein